MSHSFSPYYITLLHKGLQLLIYMVHELQTWWEKKCMTYNYKLRGGALVNCDIRSRTGRAEKVMRIYAYCFIAPVSL